MRANVDSAFVAHRSPSRSPTHHSLHRCVTYPEQSPHQTASHNNDPAHPAEPRPAGPTSAPNTVSVSTKAQPCSTWARGTRFFGCSSRRHTQPSIPRQRHMKHAGNIRQRHPVHHPRLHRIDDRDLRLRRRTVRCRVGIHMRRVQPASIGRHRQIARPAPRLERQLLHRQSPHPAP